MKNKPKKKKVYCIDCEFYFSIKKPADPRENNENNDCKYYKKKLDK